MHHHPGPFSIPAINNFVPEKWKPFILIGIVIIIQFTSGIYLATSNEMVGATSLMQEDILMAGYASLIGMALTFTVMLRLKMRFTSKASLLVSTSVLIITNIICLYTNNIVVLVATCFFAGIFKMWATFICNSTIQLWLTPKRDMSVFFCYIYLLVQSAILFSGITNLYVALFANWQYMHWVIIGALLIVILTVLLLFNNGRVMKPFPLFGIDWLGAFLWALILLTLNFIFLYGKHYDWWFSAEIKTATIFLIVLLALNIWRASFIRHPFIALQTFKYKAVYLTFLLYIVINVFLAPAYLIEHIYFGKVLHYDAAHLAWTNGVGWLGVLAGAGFSFYYFAKKKHSYKSTFLIGFGALLMYLLLMYFGMDYETTKAGLIAPLFFRNFGYVVMGIAMLTQLTKVPFHHFFQAVSVQGFISMGIGSAMGAAVMHHIFDITAIKNYMLLSSGIDRVNGLAAGERYEQLYDLVQVQALMVSFKEIYGYLLVIGLLCFAIFLFYKYAYLPKNVLYPRSRAIKRMLRKEIA